MKHRSLLAITIIITSLGASLLCANPPKEWKQPSWKVSKEQYNVVKAVNPAANTVSISHVGGKDKQDRDLTVGTFTEIIVDGNKTTIASLKAGMHVDYTLGGDGTSAARIETRKEHAPPPTPVPTATPSFPHFEKKK